MSKAIQGYPYDYEIDSRFSPVYQNQITQLTCIVPGGGCVYYRAHKGDVCPFCAFPPFSRHVVKGPGFEDFFEAWTLNAFIYKEMYQASMEQATDVSKLAIFNGGSFFPHTELPKDFQHFVYQDIAGRPNIKQLMVEAYPSFITENALREALECIGKTDFMVGIGFESHNDVVRNKFLKKRIERVLFEEKIRMMQRLGVQVFVYVFLKAPQLNEGQALTEALKTIEYLHNLGVDEIALSCAFVPPGTVLETQYHAGDFRPPWLWTILKIMDLAEQNQWPLSIGGFEDNPAPIAGPNNCVDCDLKINNIIDGYRNNRFLPESIHSLNCHCKTEWMGEVKGHKGI